ncbi:MAG: GrpB family protein [Actinomycetota bacterium]|nr:GrpB family protein [Actinomycetota bacterium]
MPLCDERAHRTRASPRVATSANAAAPVIADYDPAWPERSSELAGVIRGEVDHDIVRLDHTGSTSVPGLGAKT